MKKLIITLFISTTSCLIGMDSAPKLKILVKLKGLSKLSPHGKDKNEGFLISEYGEEKQSKDLEGRRFTFGESQFYLPLYTESSTKNATYKLFLYHHPDTGKLKVNLRSLSNNPLTARRYFEPSETPVLVINRNETEITALYLKSDDKESDSETVILDEEIIESEHNETEIIRANPLLLINGKQLNQEKVERYLRAIWDEVGDDL